MELEIAHIGCIDLFEGSICVSSIVILSVRQRATDRLEVIFPSARVDEIEVGHLDSGGSKGEEMGDDSKAEQKPGGRTPQKR